MDNVSIGEVIALAKTFGGGGGGGGGSSGGGVLYVTASQDMVLDKNFEEIQTALDGGKVVIHKIETQSDGVLYAPLIAAASYPEDPYYSVTFYHFGLRQEISFGNTSPTDPLVYEEEE